MTHHPGTPLSPQHVGRRPAQQHRAAGTSRSRAAIKIGRCTPVEDQQIVGELGARAFCIKDEQLVAAYLFGPIAQTTPTAYVHLVGVRQTYRRCGLARRLYQHVVAVARLRGCTALKTITTPGISVSIAFHRALGLKLLGAPNAEGSAVVGAYVGPGQDRVIFYGSIV